MADIPANRARAFLQQYRERYRTAYALLARRDVPLLKKKEVTASEVPPLPAVNKDGRLKVVKWSVKDEKGLVRFYDDGKDLPPVDAMVIVSQSLAIATANGIQVKAESWVLRKE
jgi:hypothetical protein